LTNKMRGRLRDTVKRNKNQHNEQLNIYSFTSLRRHVSVSADHLQGICSYRVLFLKLYKRTGLRPSVTFRNDCNRVSSKPPPKWSTASSGCVFQNVSSIRSTNESFAIPAPKTHPVWVKIKHSFGWSVTAALCSAGLTNVLTLSFSGFFRFLRCY
jgi:hypothetical protein